MTQKKRAAAKKEHRFAEIFRLRQPPLKMTDGGYGKVF